MIIKNKRYALVKLKRDLSYYFEFSKRLRTDRKLALIAISDDYVENYYAIDDSLTNDRKFILEAVKVNAWIFSSLNKEFRADGEILIEAIKQVPSAIDFASSKLQKDPEIKMMLDLIVNNIMREREESSLNLG